MGRQTAKARLRLLGLTHRGRSIGLGERGPHHLDSAPLGRDRTKIKKHYDWVGHGEIWITEEEKPQGEPGWAVGREPTKGEQKKTD